MERDLAKKLVSPHGFDGQGPVPPEVTAAAKRIAQLRTHFVLSDSLTVEQIEELFDAALLQAEWMRELYEALHRECGEEK
jgi:hypothetical protein